MLSLFYWASGLIPRSERKWVFGSYSNAFNDNSKYLYIHVVENHVDIDAVWITDDAAVQLLVRSAGGRAYARWSFQGLYACLTSKYWFYSAYVKDINYYCSRNATLVNLWHGIPLKKIEFDIKHGPLAKLYENPSFGERHIFSPFVFKCPHFVLSTSENVSSEAFSSAFRVSHERCLALGYPRTDVFFKSSDEQEKALRRWATPEVRALIDEIKKFNSCFIYMPTWRDANPDFIEKSGWNFSILSEMLVANKSLLLLKLHVATPREIIQDIAGLSNIYLVPATEDIYSILPHTSGLITDYSSVAFDYVLLNKPIYYYSFDLREYEADSRGFYYSYQDCMAGRFIESPMDFLKFDPSNEADAFRSTREVLIKRFFSYADSSSAERVVQRMKSN